MGVAEVEGKIVNKAEIVSALLAKNPELVGQTLMDAFKKQTGEEIAPNYASKLRSQFLAANAGRSRAQTPKAATQARPGRSLFASMVNRIQMVENIAREVGGTPTLLRVLDLIDEVGGLDEVRSVLSMVSEAR